jgi:prepilin-type N-terminal cleavage/methylation domain-containing protein/prepilin-type processing-associated H-X9-DG protein
MAYSRKACEEGAAAMRGRGKGFAPLEVKKDSSKNKKILTGFTLIELLAVIAILAILLAILMPTLKKAREQGQCTVCKANLKSYALAIFMYTSDNDDKFCDPRSCYFSQTEPYGIEDGLINPIHVRWCNGELNLKDHPEYAGPFFRYMKDAKAFICPTFIGLVGRTSEDPYYKIDAKNIRNYEPWYNYTMNAYLGNANSEVKQSRAMKLSEVRHPGETFSFTEESVLVDTRYNASGLNDTYMIPGSDNMIASWLNSPVVKGDYHNIRPGPNGVGQFWDVIAGFHYAPSGDPMGGKGNCAFLDAHVGSHTRLETFPLSWPR